MTGKNSYVACGASSIINNVLKGENVLKFSDFDINPKIEDAQRGTALARKAHVDLIIAVGGGSVIDMAKLIKAFYAEPDACHDLAHGKAAMTDPNIPMIVVPTTAGSGSEATHFAVVYIGLNKFSLASDLILPETVILDGKLIRTGTAYQKACNGLDALAQAIESAWAAGSTELSRNKSFEAVRLCVNYLEHVVDDRADDQALQGMLEAANLAGQAINISKTTAAHAWSYGITSLYNVPHGHAVWLTLPAIFQIHASCEKEKITDLRGGNHLEDIMIKLMEILSIPIANQAENILKKYLSNMKVETSLFKIGANTGTKRKALSQKVNIQRLSNNPVSLNEAEIKTIFQL